MKQENQESISIHQKMQNLKKLTMIGLFVILGTMACLSFYISISMQKSIKLRDELESIKAAEFSVTQIALASMDIIVDKADGKVLPEREKELEDGFATITTEALPIISNIYQEMESPDKYNSILETMNTLKKRSMVDLKYAVESQAMDDVFAKLDDDIDGMASSLSEQLNNTDEILHAELTDALKISQLSSTALIIGNICLFILALAGTYKIMHFIQNMIVTPMEEITVNTTTAISKSALALQSTTGNLNSLMDNAADRTTEGAQKTAIIASSVEGVAAAVEELTSSISEIRRQANLSTEVSGLAVQEATNMSKTIASLNIAAQGIGEITELINKIAESTNLLALNATIEAARAGDAGKGFAVVATEVKNLAVKTAEATNDISQKINEMQEISTKAVAVIGNIQDTISDINIANSNVMASVEQQSIAAEEINRTINEATVGLKGTSEMIAGIDKTIQDTKEETKILVSANQNLSEESAIMLKKTKILIHGES